MTEKQLQNYTKINQEIFLLEMELEKENQRKQEMQADGMESISQLSDQVREMLSAQIRKRYQERIQMEGWIQGIEDSRVRQAIRLHYLKCFSWQQTAMRMGVANEQTVRMMVKRYLDKGI